MRLCRAFLGFFGSDLLFIDKASWFSSINLKPGMANAERENYTRHFFVPKEFVTKVSGLLPIISPDKDCIFVVEGELAVVRNGFKFSNFVKVGKAGRQ